MTCNGSVLCSAAGWAGLLSLLWSGLPPPHLLKCVPAQQPILHALLEQRLHAVQDRLLAELASPLWLLLCLLLLHLLLLDLLLLSLLCSRCGGVLLMQQLRMGSRLHRRYRPLLALQLPWHRSAVCRRMCCAALPPAARLLLSRQWPLPVAACKLKAKAGRCTADEHTRGCRAACPGAKAGRQPRRGNPTALQPSMHAGSCGAWRKLLLLLLLLLGMLVGRRGQVAPGLLLLARWLRAWRRLAVLLRQLMCRAMPPMRGLVIVVRVPP